MRTAARRAIRWLLGGSGALKRGTDRIEAASRLFVLLAALTAVPGALLIAGAVRGHLEAVAAAEASVRSAVVAHLVHDADAASASYDSSGLLPARVRWTTPGGDLREGTVRVAPSRRAGEPVRVWLTAAGTLTSPPLDRHAIDDDVTCAAILAPIGIPVLAYGLHRLVRSVLDRRRSRQWATAWHAVAPGWTARPG